MCNTYGNYKNHDTWTVATRLKSKHNKQHSEYIKLLVRACCAEIEQDKDVVAGRFTKEVGLRRNVAHEIREYVKGFAPLPYASIEADLLGAAIWRVDFREIADIFLADPPDGESHE